MVHATTRRRGLGALGLTLGLYASGAAAQTSPTATGVTTPAGAEVTPAGAAVTPSTAPTPPQDVVAAGEEVPGSSVRRGRSETIIEAPLDVVAREMTEFGRYTEFMPHVREARVVHRNRADTDVYLSVPLSPSLGVIWALVRVHAARAPGRVELTGQAVDGNMDRFETHTVLERVEGPVPRTRVTFQILAVPRLPFPSSVFSREMVDAARTVANNLRARVASVTALTAPGSPARASR